MVFYTRGMCNDDNDNNGLGQPAIWNFFYGFYLDMTSFELQRYFLAKMIVKKIFYFTENTVFSFSNINE